VSTLTGPQVTIRATGLHLGNILFPESKFTIYTKDVLSDGQRGHSIGVVWNTTQVLCTLSSSEWLPPRLSTTLPRMHWRYIYIWGQSPAQWSTKTYRLPNPSCRQFPRQDQRTRVQVYRKDQQEVPWSQEFAREWGDRWWPKDILSRNDEIITSESVLTSTYFSKQRLGRAPSEGKIVPLAPPSGISLFLSDWVAAKL